MKFSGGEGFDLQFNALRCLFVLGIKEGHESLGCNTDDFLIIGH